MIIGNKNFDTKHHAYIMGILNVTPDSFSDGGKYNNLDAALKHAEQMILEGVDIIDIGGESTRPGYTQISDAEEIERVCKVIEALKSRFDTPLSIDTYKSKVAFSAISSGIDLINDIWGFKYDANMASIVATAGVACCLMHNRTTDSYNNLMEDVLSDLQESINLALSAGIAKDKILVDPGIGFAKDYETNLKVMQQVERLQTLGYPILLGASKNL
nr:dihydropteroate synthase [Cellulosilyticum ruminicola]